jgi:hypothetical protein
MFIVYLINLEYNNCVSEHFMIIRHLQLVGILFLRLLKPGFEVLSEVFLLSQTSKSPPYWHLASYISRATVYFLGYSVRPMFV